MIKLFKFCAVALLLCLLAIVVAVAVALQRIPGALDAPEDAPAGLLIDNVRLVSMHPDRPRVEASQAVLIQGESIVSIGEAGAINAPAGTLVIQGEGRTLIPGLIDAHVHLFDEAELAAYLAHGVTGLRNMSGFPFHLDLIERIEQGELLAPDLITTGPILNSPGPNANLLQQFVTTADEARQAVGAQHAAGFRRLKVYSNLTREAYEAIVAEARRLDMRMTGHSPEGERTAGIPYKQAFTVPWEESLGVGLSPLEHVETLVWHSLRDDLDEQKMRAVARRLADSGEAVSPTLIAHRRLVSVAESRGAYLRRPGSETINPLVRLLESDAEAFWSGVDVSHYEGPHATFFLTATGMLHEAGVPLIVGTDAGGFGIIPGASLTRELELLVRAGLSPYEALASATRVSAESLGFDRSGVIAVGFRANLVLLDGDPLNDISVAEFPSAVILRGQFIDSSALMALRQGARDTSVVRTAWRLAEYLFTK